MKKIPVGIQLYTLRDECQNNMRDTLRKVKEIGYQGVELAGYGDLTVVELKEELENLGLKITSAHIAIEELEGNLENVIADNKLLGNKYVVCPYLGAERRSKDGYLDFIRSSKVLSDKLAAEGITLLYHNHDFELEDIVGDKCALDSILASKNVDAEIDVFWVTFVGQNPVEWLKRYKGRVPLVHLKDMTNDGKRAFAEVGSGCVDIDGILEIGEEVGVKWFIVEQDICQTPPFECIETSLNYLKTKLTYLK